MAQTGFTPIQLYSSSTPTNAPSAGNLTNDTKGSELAINIADKNLFFKDSTNAVNTVPIRQSGAASDGWLSSTDWNTFNNKQPAGTYVTSVTGTAPVVSSGGTTPAISMAAATTSVNGYLTSTDWNTFNGKQAVLVSGTNIKTVSGTTLLGSGDLGTIGVGYGGTGTSTAFTAGSVVFAGASGVYNQDNSNLFWDDTNNFLGLGTASPTNYVQLGASSVIGQDANSLYIGSNFKNNGQRITANYAAQTYWDQTNGAVVFRTAASGAAGSAISFTETMRIHSSGGMSLGNTTDPGAGSLLVNGTVLVGTTSSSTTTNGLKALTIAGGSYLFSNNSSTTNSDITYATYSTGAGAYRFYVGMGGTVYATSTTITAISDQRLKENIVDLPDGLDAVMALKPRKFDWKAGKGKDIKGDRGFIAQEFETVFPDMIEKWKDPVLEGEEPYKAISANLIPTLVKAIQEQQAIIEQLKAKIGL